MNVHSTTSSQYHVESIIDSLSHTWNEIYDLFADYQINILKASETVNAFCLLYPRLQLHYDMLVKQNLSIQDINDLCARNAHLILNSIPYEHAAEFFDFFNDLVESYEK